MTKFNHYKQVQDYCSQASVIILGSGASVALGLPTMDELAKYIKSSINAKQIPRNQMSNWKEFCYHLNAKIDLESALHKVNFSEEMTDIIASSAWKLINRRDEKVYKNSLTGRCTFPLGRLLSYMFRSTKKKINIVTTNYDRLAEYACDQEEWHHHNGFSHGYTKKLSKSKNRVTCDRTVNIWKVHGSLDWFRSESDETIAVASVKHIPDEYKPQIVTPGIRKYQRTYLEPLRTIIANADTALDNANSYLCFGFGFRDEHIQPKMLLRCRNDNASITIATHTLTKQAKDFLFSQEIKNFLAIERGERDEQSRIFSSLHDGPISINKNHWSMDGFIELIA
ncbi:MAG: SIR2 family protein [Hyphomicrobiales bacterium]|nr:SIR2 family protein [Hyphomicrobiales bacterium]